MTEVCIACGGWAVRERMTSVADIRSFLSQTAPAQPIPNWIFATLDLFEQEDVPATYFYSRCRTCQSIFSKNRLEDTWVLHVAPAVYIQYHQAKNLPSNFIAIGDSVMESNPISGYPISLQFVSSTFTCQSKCRQGLVKAFVGAVTLNAMLARYAPDPSRHLIEFKSVLSPDFSKNFFAALATRTGHVWSVFLSPALPCLK